MNCDTEILEPFCCHHHPHHIEVPEEVKELAKIKNTLQKLYLLKPEMEKLAEIIENIKTASTIDMNEVNKLIELIKGLNDSNAIEIMSNRYSDSELEAIKQVSTTINSIRALAEGAVAGSLKPVDVIIEIYNRFSILTELQNNIDSITKLADIQNKLYILSEKVGLFEDIYSMKDNIESVNNNQNNINALSKITTPISILSQTENRTAIVNVSNNLSKLTSLADNLNTDYYNKTETDNLLSLKEDKATIQANYFTKTEINNLLDNKADKNEYYTKTEVDEVNKEFKNNINQVKLDQSNLLTSVNKTASELEKQINTQRTELTTASANMTASLTNMQNALTSTNKSINDRYDELLTNVTNVSAQLSVKDTDLQNKIDIINSYIPNTTTTTNTLADKEYVREQVASSAARAISADANGAGFDSLAALTAGPWYSLGVETTPQINNYAVVKKDANHNGNDVRYNYDGKIWVFFQEFQSGSSWTPTTSQQAVLDSGITATKVNQIDKNTTAISTESTARENMDNTLLARIATEEGTRETAVNKLTSDISEEKLARENEDNQLLGKIEQEALDRIAGDNEIKTKLETANSEVDVKLKEISQDINDINVKIPVEASETNQLADEDFVKEQIAAIDFSLYVLKDDFSPDTAATNDTLAQRDGTGFLRGKCEAKEYFTMSETLIISNTATKNFNYTTNLNIADLSVTGAEGKIDIDLAAKTYKKPTGNANYAEKDFPLTAKLIKTSTNEEIGSLIFNYRSAGAKATNISYNKDIATPDDDVLVNFKKLDESITPLATKEEVRLKANVAQIDTKIENSKNGGFAELNAVNKFSANNTFSKITLETQTQPCEEVKMALGVPRMVLNKIVFIDEPSITKIFTKDIKDASSANEGIFTTDLSGDYLVINGVAAGSALLNITFHNGYVFSTTILVKTAAENPGANLGVYKVHIEGIKQGQVFAQGATFQVKSYIYWDKNDPRNAAFKGSAPAYGDIFVENAERGNANCSIAPASGGSGSIVIDGQSFTSNTYSFNVTCTNPGVYTLFAFYRGWGTSDFSVPNTNARMLTQTLTFVVTADGSATVPYVYERNDAINRAFVDSLIGTSIVKDYIFLKIPEQGLVLNGNQERYVNNVETNLSKDEIEFVNASPQNFSIEIKDDGKWAFNYFGGGYYQGVEVPIKYKPLDLQIGKLVFNTNYGGAVSTPAINYEKRKQLLEKSDVLDIFYPINTLYSTLDANFDPNTTWGGTWEKLANQGANNEYIWKRTV